VAGKRAIGGTKQFGFRSQSVRTGWIQGKPDLTRGGVVPQILRNGQGMLRQSLLLMLLRTSIVATHATQITQATLGGIGPVNQALVQTITGHHPGEAVQISQEDYHPATDPPKLDQYVIGMLWKLLLLLLLLILWTLPPRRRHMRALPAVGTVQHRRRRGRIGRWHVIDAPSFEEVAFLHCLSLRCRLASITTSTTTIIIVWIRYDLFVLIINIQAQRNVEGMPESLEVGSAGQLENYG
jgi:hypothetical protein